MELKPQAPVIGSDGETLEIAENLTAEIAQGAALRYVEQRPPLAETARFSASGLGGIRVAAENGGAGVSAVTLAKMIAKIASADAPLAQILRGHFLALDLIQSQASPAQRQYFETLALKGYRFATSFDGQWDDFPPQASLFRRGDRLFASAPHIACPHAPYADFIAVIVADEGIGQIAILPRESAGVTLDTKDRGLSLETVALQADWLIALEKPTLQIPPLARLLHAAIDLGIGEGALTSVAPYIKTRARPWIDAKVDHASNDPLTLYIAGEMTQRLAEAEALLLRAARLVDAAKTHPSSDTQTEAVLAVAAAKVLTTKAGLFAASKFLELAGTSATSRTEGHDRHWQAIRSHSLQDPIRMNAYEIGLHALQTHPSRYDPS